MKRRGLYLPIAFALSCTGMVHAQDNIGGTTGNTNDVATTTYDDRWYVAPMIGYDHNDTSALPTENQIYLWLGVGKFVSPNVSVDLFADRTVRRIDYGIWVAVDGQATISVSTCVITSSTGTHGVRTWWAA
jgi:OOP family OmpA-OmpF porin